MAQCRTGHAHRDTRMLLKKWWRASTRRHIEGGCAGESMTRLGRVVVEDVSTAVAAQ